MKILKTLFIISSFILSTYAHAEFDKFNSYQWNPQSKTPWYEWWYYKIVLPETKDSFFFVYGIVNPWDHAKSMGGTRSYVGMGDFGVKNQVENLFPLNNFHAAYSQTLIDIAGLSATDQNIKGELTDTDGQSVSWDISVKKEWAFNAMGWAIDKNITNIKWYPAQASARCSGTVINKGKLYQFSNAPCYQDRNWGHSFPLWWTWIVSNHFKNNPDTVLVTGGGRPKYYDTNFPFEGATVGLKHKGVVYHFRPNDLDNVKVDIKFGKWEVVANNSSHKVEISAFAPKEKFMDLQFRTPTGEIFHDYEALIGEVTVKLYKREFFRWKLIETLYSDVAGIEYGEPSSEKNRAKAIDKFFKSEKHLQ
ncbi:MAG: hypothetical protein EHM20_03300 [Alphaproteobacteria bacterium]|nr:MAG: hypothetical protein EHM20_03300 [Alphaproteobacteria bacterium]